MYWVYILITIAIVFGCGLLVGYILGEERRK